MSAILAAIGAKAGWIGLGVILPLIVMAAKRYIPKYFGGLFSKMLGKGMENIADIKDPVRRELVRKVALDLVRLAEYEMPENMGADKYAKVAAWLCGILPFLRGQDKAIEDIIEASVVAMDNELKKASADRIPPDTDPYPSPKP